MRFMALILSSRNPDAFPARGLARRGRGASIARARAAIFGEIAEQRVHGVIARGIDHRSALPPNRDQSRLPQAVEMKGERVGRKPDRGGDLSGGHAGLSGLDQEPIRIEAVILSQRPPRSTRVPHTPISTTTEPSRTRQ